MKENMKDTSLGHDPARPYSQILDLSAKACQWKTFWLFGLFVSDDFFITLTMMMKFKIFFFVTDGKGNVECLFLAWKYLTEASTISYWGDVWATCSLVWHFTYPCFEVLTLHCWSKLWQPKRHGHMSIIENPCDISQAQRDILLSSGHDQHDHFNNFLSRFLGVKW
jgi:hypothetical protein